MYVYLQPGQSENSPHNDFYHPIWFSSAFSHPPSMELSVTFRDGVQAKKTWILYNWGWREKKTFWCFCLLKLLGTQKRPRTYFEDTSGVRKELREPRKVSGVQEFDLREAWKGTSQQSVSGVPTWINMADDMTEGNVLHSNHPKPKKQSGKTSMLLMNGEHYAYNCFK